MSFIPDTRRIIPGEGPKDARICIIGEAGGAHENIKLRPFVGPAGGVLESCLHAAGILRSECYLTNVVKVQPKGNDIAPYFNERTGSFTSMGQEWVDELYEELRDIKANVIVPLGKTALAATTGRKQIAKYRGYVIEGVSDISNRKVIPAYHPAASLRGQYILRYYISADLKKAKAEAAFPDIRRPQRRIVIPETIAECFEWLDFIESQSTYACDIEVVNFEVSAIGFATSADLAISIPMYHQQWDLEEEVVLWRRINKVLTNENILKIFQNGVFDIGFLATRCGIHVAPPIADTMVGHHVMYPEMLKGLEFLVSMYCGSQEYYKDMVKFDNIKKEA